MLTSSISTLQRFIVQTVDYEVHHHRHVVHVVHNGSDRCLLVFSVFPSFVESHQSVQSVSGLLHHIVNIGHRVHLFGRTLTSTNRRIQRSLCLYDHAITGVFNQWNSSTPDNYTRQRQTYDTKNNIVGQKTRDEVGLIC